MEAISFFIKSLLVAFVAIVLMQIEVGGATIEDHVMSFVRGGTVAQPLQQVADGGVKAVRNGWKVVSRWINNNKPAVGERASSFFNMQRSEAYRESEEKKSSSDRSRE